ncbi:MAG TPA: hypothetical protein ENH55_01430 [Aurantimonas coralicida]|uniref:Uncharacterized protein n=1 Tax=marine sediment metagenome TaxID=412755 RepID=A0A0F9S411_9ZZZZ|nr:hypothetical protein [Aurantimonas coralicida]
MKFQTDERTGLLRQCSEFTGRGRRGRVVEDDPLDDPLLPDHEPAKRRPGEAVYRLRDWFLASVGLIDRVETAHGITIDEAACLGLLEQMLADADPGVARRVENELIHECGGELGLVYGMENAVGIRPVSIRLEDKGGLKSYIHNHERTVIDVTY